MPIHEIKKEEPKARRARQKLWTPEQRTLHAKLLIGLRNGTFRPWEQLSTYDPETCVITKKRNSKK
jgi:hypothetical protein